MSKFRVQEHIIQASHIREYPRSLADEDDDDLKLAVKQYTPLDNLTARPGDVTIIAGHANGFPKELYEPLWDELYQCLDAQGRRIRHIFIADVAFQGQSGVLNESRLGNDPAWSDSARDFFMMINHFRTEIKQPIIGVGHSMGGVNLVTLSNMHPRLFTSLILIDPPLQRRPALAGFEVIKASARRRDRWPTRAAAEASFRKSKFYQGWDPRVLDIWLKIGLRELPTYRYPADPSSATDAPKLPPAEREVTLTTTRDQEVMTFTRPGVPTGEGVNPYPQPGIPAYLSHPDADVENGPVSPFYRPEAQHAFQRLQFLRPSVLWIFADKSGLSAEPSRSDKLAQTGIGVGGSGGVKTGRVKSIVMKGAGHLVPYEDVQGVAEHLATYMDAELARWSEEQLLLRQHWDQVPREKRSQLNPEFIEALTAIAVPGKPKSPKL